jgi:hypothetical protein
MAMYAPIPEDDLETPRRAAIPEAPIPPRPQRPAPAPAPAPRQAAQPAPRQAIPGAGDESNWLPPDEAERQNAAAHKELGKDYNPKRLATTEFMPEIAKAVRTTVQSMFGIGGEGQAVPAERPDTDGYARGKGAAPSEDVKAARKAVNPDGKLSPAEETLALYKGTYLYYAAQGDMRKANEAVTSLALHAKRTLMQLGALGEAAIAAGDKKALIQILRAANDLTPDGTTLTAKETKNGLDLRLTDINGKLTENGEAGMDMLMELVGGLQNGTAWLRSMGALEKADDPRDVELKDRQRQAALVRAEDTIAGKGGGGGGNTLAERRERQRTEQYEARVQAIENDTDLSDGARQVALSSAAADFGFAGNARPIRSTERKDIMDAFSELKGDQWGELDSTENGKKTKMRLEQLAFEIWRGSDFEDVRDAAAIAIHLLSRDFNENLAFDPDSGAFSHEGNQFYLRGNTWESILQRHNPSTKGGAADNTKASDPAEEGTFDATNTPRAASAREYREQQERARAETDARNEAEERARLYEEVEKAYAEGEKAGLPVRSGRRSREQLEGLSIYELRQFVGNLYEDIFEEERPAIFGGGRRQ